MGSLHRRYWRFGSGAKRSVGRLCLGALLSTLLLTGCSDRARSDESAGTEAGTGKIGGRGMNVLFVSVDTTRADCLGCYGHPVVKTPNIDRLAAEGTRFACCVSSAPITLPSHSTMMTGSYPFVHGARDNGMFVLGQENVTLAELFKQAGYSTHAEVAAAVLNRHYGLNQGFDTYGDLHRRGGVAAEPKDAAKASREIRKSGPEQDPDETEPQTPDLPTPWSWSARRGDEITRRGIELLSRNRGNRFFVFLHYFDPHQPDEAPERFARQYEDGYLAEIAFFDEQFGRLMDTLRSLDLAENTLVILTSDHGEGRGQHGEQTHSYFLYDTTLLVPLILWCPGHVPAGQVVHSQVRLLDLAPTVVDFVRLERSPQMQGTSLLPLLADPPGDLHLSCYADTLAPQLMFGYSRLRCLRADGWKYVLAPEPELYHVAEDPLEMFNLANVEPGRAAAMREHLRDLIAGSPPPPGSRAARQAVDRQELRKLQALGYLAGGSAAGHEGSLASGSELDDFEPVGINPRTRIEPIELMNVSLGFLLGGRYEEAERLYRRLLELEPENAEARGRLAGAIAAQGRFEEAEAEYRRAVKLNPADVLVRLSLGKLLGLRGDLSGAEAQYRRAVELDVTYHVSHLHLANVLSRLGQFEEAFVEYAAAARLAPDLPIVPLQWAMACRALGRLKEAETRIRHACELAPDLPRARLLLAHLLGEQGRRTEAIRELRVLLQSHPENIPGLEMLASEYVDQGDYEPAAAYFRRAAEAEPQGPRAAFNLGRSLALKGDFDQAVVQYRKAVEMKPNFVRALIELARALEKTGRVDEAIETYDQLLGLQPQDPIVYPLAANLLDSRGQKARAIEVLRQGHARLPDDPDIANDLAWRLATSPRAELRDAAEAVKLAEHANCMTNGEKAGILDTLAAAYAEAGHFEKAIATADGALKLARQRNDNALATSITSRRSLYAQHQAYRDP